MKRIIALMLALVIGAALFAGCGKNAADPEREAAPVIGIEGMTLRSFEEKLLSYLDVLEKGNYVVSPLSFKFSLALLIAGARGDTQRELLDAFAAGSEDEFANSLYEFYEFAKTVDPSFDKAKDVSDIAEKQTALRLANSVWSAKNDAGLDAEYVKKVRKLGAEVLVFDSVSDVNGWVSDKTGGMIPQLIPNDFSAEDIESTLINAMYFKSLWMHEFDKDKTEQDVFTAASGEKKQKDYMSGKLTVPYYSDDDTQLVILPFRANFKDVEMVFVIGSTENIRSKIAKAAENTVNVKIPKFKVETKLDNNELIAFLKSCGVEKAFSKEADLSGMFTGGIHRVGKAVQNSVFSIDEEGAEGASATAQVIYRGIAPEDKGVTFVADRPFAFFVTAQREIGALEVLFEGRIVE